MSKEAIRKLLENLSFPVLLVKEIQIILRLVLVIATYVLLSQSKPIYSITQLPALLAWKEVYVNYKYMLTA